MAGAGVALRGRRRSVPVAPEAWRQHRGRDFQWVRRQHVTAAERRRGGGGARREQAGGTARRGGRDWRAEGGQQGRAGRAGVEGGMFGAGQVRQNPYDCLNMIGPLQPSRCKGGRRGIHSGGLVGPSCLETQQ